MPTSDCYKGKLSDRVRLFAEHHYERNTRHISRDEYTMLLEATDRLAFSLSVASR